ncbi:unnamed protein product, partial [Durusdinium trenchii]
MAVFLSHARENGYKFPSPDLAGWPETPETSEILQRIKTIQRKLETALEKGLPIKATDIEEDSPDEEIMEMQKKTRQLLSKLPMRRIQRVLKAASTATAPLAHGAAHGVHGVHGLAEAAVATRRAAGAHETQRTMPQLHEPEEGDKPEPHCAPQCGLEKNAGHTQRGRSACVSFGAES